MKIKLVNFLNKFLELFNYRIKKINGSYLLDKNIFFDETVIFKKIFNNKKNLTVFDVGCYHGEFIDCIEKTFPNSSYFGFEAEENSFRYLGKKYKNNKNTLINNYLIGDKHEEVTFNILSEDSTGNSVIGTSNEGLINKKIKKKQITLDSFIDEHKIKSIDILKIDTQGYEKECLLGAKNHLEKGTFKSLMLEVMFENTYERSSSFFEIENIILGYGYKLRDICHLKKSFTEAKSLMCDVIYCIDEM